MEQYLTTQELSERIKLSPGTIRNLVWKNKLKLNVHYLKPTGKLLFVWSEVQTWLHDNPIKRCSEPKDRSESLIHIWDLYCWPHLPVHGSQFNMTSGRKGGGWKSGKEVAYETSEYCRISSKPRHEKGLKNKIGHKRREKWQGLQPWRKNMGGFSLP